MFSSRRLALTLGVFLAAACDDPLPDPVGCGEWLACMMACGGGAVDIVCSLGCADPDDPAGWHVSRVILVTEGEARHHATEACRLMD